MTSIFSLTGKTILITGASSGIGRAVAQQCATAGASCLITARNEQRLKETLNSLEGEGHQMFLADLTFKVEIDKLILQLPKVDGIVCCAGVVESTILKFSDDEDILRLFNTNVFSATRLVRNVVQNNAIRKEGSIVFISSISGVKCGYIGGSIYGATKGALEGFTKAVALELAPKKIRVNTITPGMVETSLLKDVNVDKEQIKLDKQHYPLKRYGKPEEVGYAAVYLLSPAASWITGTSLLIDGGYTLN